MTITDVSIQAGSHVDFQHDGKPYTYLPMRGRLYIGTLGGAIHESDAGSFEVKNDIEMDEILSNAALLGARVYASRSS